MTAVTISPNDSFYRLRKDPAQPSDSKEYDSPPNPGKGRLDSPGLAVMYGSQDLQICIHECRVTAEDNLFVATLEPSRELKLLDLTHLLDDKETEFESLHMAVHMLFLAGRHDYPIARDIALAAQKAGFDGLVHPSYFALLEIRARPFYAVLAISTRERPACVQH